MWKISYSLLLSALAFKIVSCSAPIWTSYQFDTGYGNREELVVYEMVANDSLKVDLQVSKWKSVTVDAINYAVGTMETGPTLAVLKTWMTSQGEIKIESEVHNLSQAAIDVVLLDKWNRSSKAVEVIAVVATNGRNPEISWYKVNNTHLCKFWSWNLHKNATHVNSFTLSDGLSYLLVISEIKNVTSADIYLYDVEQNPPAFWLSQTLRLESPANASAFASLASRGFLFIPQRSTNTLLVFRHNESHFEPYDTIHSEEVDDVITFRNGFKSYIAVDGLDAAIYQLTDEGLVRESMQDFDLSSVEYWLSVRTFSYRDDSVMLAQRILDYGTHKSATVDLVVPDGGTFVEHEDVSCKYFGETKSTMGTCLIEHNDEGIEDSASLYFGDSVLGMLVPHRKLHSIMFVMKVTFKEVQGPAAYERKLILDAQKRIENIINSHEEELLKIQENMKNPLEVTTVGKASETLPASKASRTGNLRIFNSTARSGDIPVDEDEELADLMEDVKLVSNNITSLKVQVDDVMERIQKQEHFKTIVFDGSVKFQNEVNVSDTQVETIGEDPAVELLQDIVRRNHMEKITGNKTFHEIEVEELAFEQLNDLSAEALVFKTNGILSINTDVIFQGNVYVKGNVEVTSNSINNIPVEQIVEIKNTITSKLKFDNVKVTDQFNVNIINDIPLPTEDFRPNEFLAPHLTLESFYVPQDVTVDKINGYNFNEFLKDLRFKHDDELFSGHVKVNGQISTEHLDAENLNELRFPNDYFINGTHHSMFVTGFKKFNNLWIDELRMSEDINGIHPDSIMTMTDNQTISGNVTFKNLQVTKSLNYTNKLYSGDNGGFIRNPSIQQSDVIKSNVNFKHLQIDGPLIVYNNFGETNFESGLKDIIYKDDEDVSITGVKHILEGTSVRKNLEILSNAINSIPLEKIVTKDTEQVLNITHLDGVVSFENIELKGLYGGINVTDLDQTTVKLTGEQFISSTLIFTGETPEVNELEITDHINDIPVQKFVNKKSKELLHNQLQFRNVEASEIVVEGDFHGKLDKFDTEEFDRRKLSMSDAQKIEEEYSAAKCVFDNLDFKEVHDQYTGRKVLTQDEVLDEIQRLMLNGQLKIRNLNVIGSVLVNKINGIPFENPKHVPWRTNVTVPEDLYIKGDVYFDTIQIEKLANRNFNDYINSIVFKNQSDLMLDCNKEFPDGLTVEGLIRSNKLNNIPLENILRKEAKQEMVGPIEIHGDVTFDCHVTIEDNIDNVPIEDVHGRYDETKGIYIIKDDIIFKRVPHIEHLILRGFANDKNVTEHLQKLVYLDRNNTFSGKVTFHDKVKVRGTFDINENFNDVDFQDFVSQAVLRDVNDTVEGPVKFEHSVYVLNSITVVEDILARTVYGIDTKMWENDAIYINKGKLSGKYPFETININGDLTTDFLNGMSTEGLIPLRSNENLEKLEINKMKTSKDIDVKGLVNGINLEEEFNNTVLIDEDQEISAPVVFANNLTIENNLYVFGKLNGRELDKVVTTTTDQTLSAVYHFSAKTIMESNLLVSDLVNGINVSVWPQEIIMKASPQMQMVNDSWTIQGNMTFMEDVDGTGLINGMNVTQIAASVDDKRRQMNELEEQLRADVKAICKDLKNIHKAASDQIYKFKYFDHLTSVNFEVPIGIVHNFEHNGQQYILASEKEGCNSSILHFTGSKANPIIKVALGSLLQVITVRAENVSYLVTRSEGIKDCPVEGTNVWRFNGTDIEIIRILEKQKLLQDSLIPETFYGMDKNSVTEYRIVTKYDSAVKKYRTWKITEVSAAFVPRGLQTGLALRTGKELIRLIQEDPIVEPDLDDAAGESVIIGTVKRKFNAILPGKSGGDLAAVVVGKQYPRTMLAVASHEETSVRGRLDLIKIYEDLYTERLFHKIPTFRPSSLVSINFGNGETLLVFLEENSTLQIYEYKGVEGFKYRASMQIKAQHLISMQLHQQDGLNTHHVIGMVSDNSITFIKAVMAGNRIEEEFLCDSEI